jgi:FKBP-type peptidyl-prolyl cis-trans isomerase
MTSSRTLATATLAAVLVATGCQQKPPGDPTAALTDDQKAIYAFGVVVGQEVGQQTRQLRLTPEEITIFQNGLSDVLNGRKPAVDINDFRDQFQALAQARQAAGAAETTQQGEKQLASAAAEPGAVKTDSGLVIRTLTPGTGPSPAASDTVRVHYHGTLADGTVFDSSVDRGEPAEFALDQVIPCWTEGVQKMKVGEKAKLTCPPAIAYGDRAAGAIPPGSTLTFEVELLGIPNNQAP